MDKFIRRSSTVDDKQASQDASYPDDFEEADCGIHSCAFTADDLPNMASSYPKLGIALPIALSKASPKRQAEFLAGRYCAWRASRALTGTGICPERGEDRAPVWPHGLRGSIAHSENRAVAVVASSSRCRGLGIDLEFFGNAGDTVALRPYIATPHEFAIIEERHSPDHAFLTLFSAKEAMFKAVYPHLKRHLDFNEA